MRNMRWVHVVLDCRYMIMIKIVANIYLALKICRLKKFSESHQLFWACHWRVWYTCQLSRVTQWSTIVHVLFFWLSELGSLTWVTNMTADVSFVFLWNFGLWERRGGGAKLIPLHTTNIWVLCCQALGESLMW